MQLNINEIVDRLSVDTLRMLLKRILKEFPIIAYQFKEMIKDAE